MAVIEYPDNIVEIEIKVSKTVQEYQYEPWSYSITSRRKVFMDTVKEHRKMETAELTNEVDSVIENRLNS